MLISAEWGNGTLLQCICFNYVPDKLKQKASNLHLETLSTKPLNFQISDRCKMPFMLPVAEIENDAFC